MSLTVYQRKATARWTKNHADEIAVAHGCWFDVAAGKRVVDFFQRFLRHSKGEWAGQPFTLLKWQRDDVIMPLFGWMRTDGTRRYRTAYIEIPKKNGKQLALDTPIPTPQGWSYMGDLKSGDQVFDERGIPCNIVAMSDIDDREQAYRLDFSDGTSVEAGARHEWLAEAKTQRHQSRIYTTEAMFPRQLCGCEQRANFRIRNAKGLVLPEAALPIDPYVLGFWLGNGGASKPELTVNRGDVGLIRREIPYPVHIHREQEGYSDTLVIPALRAGLAALSLLGHYQDKHIPSDYLRSSIAQRWHLLQGLMDSDGCVSSSGQAIYVTTLPQLARHVLDLLRSLGIKGTGNIVHSDRYGIPNQPCYRVLFTAFDDMPVSRLSRKLSNRKQRSENLTRSDYTYIAGITPINEPVAMRCIQVDSPSHLYLAGRGMIPTHNSTLCAGLSLYGLIADGEEGAEVYPAAASRDQASIVYREAANMVKGSPELSRVVTLTESTKHMLFDRTKSIYKALSADAGTNEGLNISHLIMDEMHAQPNDLFWNALMYGGAARRQPLKIIITTAGVDQESICHEYHDKAMQIMEGVQEDDSFFGYVKSAEWAMRRAGKDEEARQNVWKDEKVWREANPSLGETISLETFREDFQAALASPRLQNAFKRYRLNIWTEQEERWLDMEHWAACGLAPLDEDDLVGQPCYAGLDLASVSDLCAFILYFPLQQAVLPYFWVPRDAVSARTEKGDFGFAQWEGGGVLRVTEGNVTDYDVIRTDIAGLAERFDIQKIAVDRWNATQIMTQLQGDGFELVQFGQGFASMSAPSKELEKLVNGHALRHGNHPVLAWNARNVTTQEDAAGNIKPVKMKGKNKIDGIVALIMALGLSIAEPIKPKSVYETRGVLVL